MIRPAIALAVAATLAGCAQGGFSRGAADIAGQRMGFVAEAVCLNNQTRRTQDRAARALNFPVVETDGASTVYVNPGTMTFMRIGPVPAQGVTIDGGDRIVVPAGTGCSVGSPAVGLEQANRLAGEILAPRLVDGSDTLAGPLGAGVNAAGGAGFFFEGLAVTLPLARTTFTDPETGEATGFDHPVILIVHN